MRRTAVGVSASLFAGFIVALVTVLAAKHLIRALIVGAIVAGVGLIITVWWASRDTGKVPGQPETGGDKPRFVQNNVFGPNYAAENLYLQVAKTEPSVSYAVLDDRVSVGTDDDPLYRTSFGVRIDGSGDVERLRLEATPVTGTVPRLPSMRSPNGFGIDPGQGSITGGGKSAVIEFNNPPSTVIFDVFADTQAAIDFAPVIVTRR